MLVKQCLTVAAALINLIRSYLLLSKKLSKIRMFFVYYLKDIFVNSVRKRRRKLVKQIRRSQKQKLLRYEYCTVYTVQSLLDFPIRKTHMIGQKIVERTHCTVGWNDLQRT